LVAAALMSWNIIIALALQLLTVFLLSFIPFPRTSVFFTSLPVASLSCFVLFFTLLFLKTKHIQWLLNVNDPAILLPSRIPFVAQWGVTSRILLRALILNVLFIVIAFGLILLPVAKTFPNQMDMTRKQFASVRGELTSAQASFLRQAVQALPAYVPGEYYPGANVYVVGGIRDDVDYRVDLDGRDSAQLYIPSSVHVWYECDFNYACRVLSVDEVDALSDKQYAAVFVRRDSDVVAGRDPRIVDDAVDIIVAPEASTTTFTGSALLPYHLRHIRSWRDVRDPFNLLEQAFYTSQRISRETTALKDSGIVRTVVLVMTDAYTRFLVDYAIEATKTGLALSKAYSTLGFAKSVAVSLQHDVLPDGSMTKEAYAIALENSIRAVLSMNKSGVSDVSSPGSISAIGSLTEQELAPYLFIRIIRNTILSEEIKRAAREIKEIRGGAFSELLRDVQSYEPAIDIDERVSHAYVILYRYLQHVSSKCDTPDCLENVVALSPDLFAGISLCDRIQANDRDLCRQRVFSRVTAFSTTVGQHTDPVTVSTHNVDVIARIYGPAFLLGLHNTATYDQHVNIGGNDAVACHDEHSNVCKNVAIYPFANVTMASGAVTTVPVSLRVDCNEGSYACVMGVWNQDDALFGRANFTMIVR
ncbi:MAG: hypothetical protein AABY13_04980, partial [Nanoarchaeota archaeon]